MTRVQKIALPEYFEPTPFDSLTLNSQNALRRYTCDSGYWTGAFLRLVFLSPDMVNTYTSQPIANLLKMPHRVLECLRIYHRPLGIRGVGAICSYRLFGWPKELTVVPVGIRNPVYIRMRTTDVSVYQEVLICGQYALDLPFSPKIIVDAGANIGMASLYFANKYPDARIIAVEPEASNFAMLVRNAKPYPNILPIQAALWYRDGEIALKAPDAANNPFSKVGFVICKCDGIPVRALTMRTLMKETEIQSIDILKVDIEGAEKEVFESSDWMDDVRCLMIAVDPSPTATRMIEIQIALNGLSSKVRVIRGAASDTNGPIEMLNSGVFSCGFFQVAKDRPKREMTRVSAVTIDHMVREFGAPTHIKVDVEGHEHAVIRGARATLRGSSPILFLELHNRLVASEGLNPSAILDELDQLGYVAFGTDGKLISRRTILETPISYVVAKPRSMSPTCVV